MNRIKLFCIPYAGGSATVYEKWKRKVDHRIEIIPLELSGRGVKSREKLYNSIDEAADNLLGEIESKLDRHDKYAIFGHSMGSLITFELYYRMKKKNLKEPKCIIVSGGKAPHVERDFKSCHDMPDDEFKKQILIYSDMSSAIFENPELYNYFVPILRSDFKIVETYKYREKEHKINCNLIALAGINDTTLALDDVKQWQEHTNKGFEMFTFESGHFFINDHQDQVLRIINEKLL